MQWSIWSKIEQILEETGVKPMLAVVPDNQDPILQVAPTDANFWNRVRSWQRAGWTIALHGYQHRYVTKESGVIGVNNRSEFAGLPAKEQERKLQKGIEIFRHERVKPDAWIAPAHSFDATTLSVLKKFDVRVISDGFFLYPYVDSEGMLWIPQQFCDFRAMPFGVWTICLHCNEWTGKEISKFRHDVDAYRKSIVTFDEIVRTYGSRRRGLIDSLAFQCLRGERTIKQARLYRYLRGYN